MKRGVVKVTACCLAGSVIFASTGLTAFAAGEMPLAGIGAEIIASQEKKENSETKKVITTGYDSLVIAQVDEYVNIRDEASTETGQIVGKLYNNSAAEIIGQTGDWYLIKSGDVTGYVNKDYFVTGAQAEELAAEVGDVGDEPFLMTYGDGVCDVDMNKLVEFHKEHGKIATLTAVMLEQQKGVLDIGGDNAVKSFREKSHTDGAPINAGYMVLNPEIFDYIDGDDTVFEREPLERLAKEGQLMSYMHKGFWQCMDTKREMDMLEKYLATGTAPWKKWD